jgi:hypothetical protein
MEHVVNCLQCPAKSIVVVGDRYLTDVVFGNLNGSLTIYTAPVSTNGENFAVRLVCCFIDLIYFRLYFHEIRQGDLKIDCLRSYYKLALPRLRTIYFQ